MFGLQLVGNFVTFMGQFLNIEQMDWSLSTCKMFPETSICKAETLPGSFMTSLHLISFIYIFNPRLMFEMCTKRLVVTMGSRSNGI